MNQPDPADQSTVRQEMLDHWGLDDEDIGSDTSSPFDELLDEFRSDEQVRKAGVVQLRPL